ncbi:competence protein CoiA [Cytobacillus sp. Hz8]|uniref:competence protein CoiA n=1 Tax=Cytobacillus sp. Hz8 TaxID=3347168 RepID=UPI0035DCB51D
MLTAKMKNGKLLCLADGMSKAELKNLKREEKFFCPQCSEKVILKMGSKRITHFAHEKGHLCSRDYDRESEYHLQGKLHLYQWLKKQALEPQIEYFIASINQKPDLTFSYEGQKYVIEFQCSTIPEELFMKRTKLYLEHSIQPIWMMAGKNIRRVADGRVKLSSFDYLFTRRSSDFISFISAYCPITNKLILLKNIYPTSIRSAITQFSIQSLSNCDVKEIISPQFSSAIDFTFWQQQINRMKIHLMLRPTPIQRRFLQELYENHLNVQLLPPITGIPTRQSIFIETPAFIWQSYILIDVFLKKRIGQLISRKQVFLTFLSRYRRKEITIRKLPLIGVGNMQLWIREYLDELTRIGCLKKVDEEYYLVRNIQLASNLEEQRRMESDFNQTFMRRYID